VGKEPPAADGLKKKKKKKEQTPKKKKSDHGVNRQGESEYNLGVKRGGNIDN